MHCCHPPSQARQTLCVKHSQPGMPSFLHRLHKRSQHRDLLARQRTRAVSCTGKDIELPISCRGKLGHIMHLMRHTVFETLLALQRIWHLPTPFNTKGIMEEIVPGVAAHNLKPPAEKACTIAPQCPRIYNKACFRCGWAFVDKHRFTWSYIRRCKTKWGRGGMLAFQSPRPLKSLEV